MPGKIILDATYRLENNGTIIKTSPILSDRFQKGSPLMSLNDGQVKYSLLGMMIQDDNAWTGPVFVNLLQTASWIESVMKSVEIDEQSSHSSSTTLAKTTTSSVSTFPTTLVEVTAVAASKPRATETNPSIASTLAVEQTTFVPQISQKMVPSYYYYYVDPVTTPVPNEDFTIEIISTPNYKQQSNGGGSDSLTKSASKLLTLMMCGLIF